MKTHLTRYLLLVTLVSIGIFSNAQRGEHNHTNDRPQTSTGGNSFDQRQFRSNPSPVDRNPNSSFGRSGRPSTFDRDVPNATASNRDRFFQPYGGRYGNQRAFTGRYPSRVINNNRVVNNSMRINNYGYNRYSSGGYAPNRYGYAPRRYEFAGAPRYSVLPRGSLTLRFHNYPYYYTGGLFYSYYDGFYEPVFAPIGIHVNILPVDYYPIYIGDRRYYYYEGTYYWETGAKDYEVVDAPVGAVLPALPRNATMVMVNGEQFYEFNGTYYKQGINNRNEVVYTVVGKYGVINNTPTGQIGLPQDLRVGDVVSTLPNGSREVTIDGEPLYVSPDNIYFRAQNNGNAINYVVVGTQQPNQ